MPLPNFFVVGATKAGTTSLYHYLDQHPQIYMSPIKEPSYFASEVRPENFADEYRQELRESLVMVQEFLNGPMQEKRFGGLIFDWEDYGRLFRNVTDQKAVGEASVCYLWSKTAARDIASRIPDAKIIMILRDPAERAFSQYLDSLTGGRTLKSFRRHVEMSMQSTSTKFEVMNPFLELGRYYEQVKRFLEAFPKENIRIYWYDDCRGQISKLLPDIFQFLGVDPNFVPNTGEKFRSPRVPRLYPVSYFLKQRGMWQPLRRMIPESLRPAFRRAVLRKREALVLDPEDRRVLVEYYRDDIQKLAALMNRDLSSWLSYG